MNDYEKVCPRCAETIKRAAVVCRYCGHEFADQTPESAAAPSSVSPSAAGPETSQTSGQANLKTAGGIIGIGCFGFLLLAIIGSIAGGGASQSTNSSADAAANAAFDMNATADTATANADAALNAAAAEDSRAAEAGTGWSYSTSHDEVRGKTIYYANVDSDNQVEFDAPYSGGSTLTMTVRKHPQYGQDVIFRISDGQFVCGVESCSGTVNYGHGPERVSLTESADYDSKTLFASSGPSIINKLKNANKVIVELPFYQEGNRQFTFSTKGLKWPPSG
jgi:Uncharacterised protein family UPF0547